MTTGSDSPKARKRPACRRCQFIRIYLMIALPFVGLMAFFPDAFAALGPKLPPVEAIAVLVPVVGLPMFVIRLVRWHRAGQR